MKTMVVFAKMRTGALSPYLFWGMAKIAVILAIFAIIQLTFLHNIFIFSLCIFNAGKNCEALSSGVKNNHTVMFYYLFNWLSKHNVPGAGVFQYISFRAAVAFVLALILSFFFGKYFIRIIRKWFIKKIKENPHTVSTFWCINFIRKWFIKERKKNKKKEEEEVGTVRQLGLPEEKRKSETPTMGGLIIIAAVLIPVLLLCQLDNIYILLMVFTTVWLGALGFVDDYLKISKHNTDGLKPRSKLLGQLILGLVVGVVMYFHPDAVIKEKQNRIPAYTKIENLMQMRNEENVSKMFGKAHHSTKTTFPFFKNHEINYTWLTGWLGDKTGKWSFLFFIPIVVFIIAAVSNGANLTDGLDGLATGTASSIAFGLAALAYISGNAIFAYYLDVMYIPNIGELVIFISALIGGCIGFYWWNCYPAKIFMGDTGSLTLGGIIAVLCIIMRKELLLPILCGIYLAEILSVIIQKCYFKHTKKRYGVGKRIFLMAPLHHHFQKKGIPETKITQHFIIISILLTVLTLVTLKIR